MEPIIRLRSRGGKQNNPENKTSKKRKPSLTETSSGKMIDLAKFKKVFTFQDQWSKNGVEWRSPSNPFVQKRKSSQGPKRNWIQFLIAVGGAILIGSVLGISILSLFFTDQPAHRSHSIDAHLESVQSNPGGLSMPLLEVTLLQAGSYQDKEKAQKTIRDFRTKGFAATLAKEDHYHIFLGVGMSKKSAQNLAKWYQEKGVHVYLKKETITGKMSNPKAELKELPEIIKIGNQIVETLTKHSVAALQNEKVHTFPFSDDISKNHQEFITKLQELTPYLSENGKEALSEMMRSVDQAVQSGVAAKDTPNHALIWQIQEGLIRYMISYHQLLQAL